MYVISLDDLLHIYLVSALIVERKFIFNLWKNFKWNIFDISNKNYLLRIYTSRDLPTIINDTLSENEIYWWETSNYYICFLVDGILLAHNLYMINMDVVVHKLLTMNQDRSAVIIIMITVGRGS